MNVLVVSDSHGKVDKLIQAVEQVHPGYVLHLSLIHISEPTRPY